MKHNIIFFITVLLLISGIKAFAQHFQPVWQTPFSPMDIFITEANLDELPLQGGDEIGIFDDDGSGNEFCVGSVSLESPIPQGDYVQVICSMDDGLNPDVPNGFITGHQFIFKYWDSSSGIEISDVEFSFPYQGYDTLFSPLGTAIVNLTGTSDIVQHVIQLEAGWSGISSYVDPVNPAIPGLLTGIYEQLEMIQNPDAYYQPGNPASTLNQWLTQSGYFIRVNEAVNLIVEGSIAVPTTVNIEEGVNLIPVLADQVVSIDALFADHLEKVVIVRDALGLGVYWPDKNITSLTEMEPGKAYLVVAAESFVLSF